MKNQNKGAGRRIGAGIVFTAVAGALAVAFPAPASAQLPREVGQIGTEILKGAAIGYAVKQSAKPLNQFINAVTLRQGVQDRQTTKVVPMLSFGDKTYIGGAQVSGPLSVINKTEAVWQVEGSKRIGDGIYRVKALVPSNSLNPLKLSRVPGVGVTAVIDVATGGTIGEGPYSRPVRGGDLIKAGAVALAVNAAARQLNDLINAITFNNNRSQTKVVPMATFGEKAYVGGGQLSGSPTQIAKAKLLWQYEDLFDRGRFRVKVLVPTDAASPTRIRRVPGVGLSALIDTTIQRQADTLEPRRPNNPAPPVVAVPGRPDDRRDPPRRDEDDDRDDRRRPGKRKGWYKDDDPNSPGQSSGKGRGKGKGGRDDR
jgi:hypothetical protein